MIRKETITKTHFVCDECRKEFEPFIFIRVRGFEHNPTLHFKLWDACEEKSGDLCLDCVKKFLANYKEEK